MKIHNPTDLTITQTFQYGSGTAAEVLTITVEPNSDSKSMSRQQAAKFLKIYPFMKEVAGTEAEEVLEPEVRSEKPKSEKAVKVKEADVEDEGDFVDSKQVEQQKAPTTSPTPPPVAPEGYSPSEAWKRAQKAKESKEK
jgi:hypothetical protein